MKIEEYIKSVEGFVASTERMTKYDGNYIFLFRGQPNDKPLLPRIARRDPNKDTTELEEKMIKEFRRRLARDRDIAAMDDWDILVYAQHHGLSTRLLDWTTNPLLALWFACCDLESSSDGHVFLLPVKDTELLDTSVEKDPFKIKKTYIVKPNLNNSRVRAQSGWFTAHRYSKKNRKFVDIHNNTSIDENVKKKSIHRDNKSDILKTLDKFGINEESVYPGPEGTAKHINWLHRNDL